MSSFSERSLRYTEFTDDFYIPETARIQSKDNKQGSVEIHNDDLDNIVKSHIESASKEALKTYNILLKYSIAKELARVVLPLNTYSEMIWTVNLRSLMNFLKQRLDEHAQYEIRKYAEAIDSIFKEKLPLNHSAFKQYILK